MTTGLQRKVALVTGGTSGIGREAAVLFAKSGAKVVVAGRREKEGNETVDLVRGSGGEALFTKTDVTKASAVEVLVKTTVEKFGRLDIAFNNAGVESAFASVANQAEADWDRAIEINLKGVWLCLKYELRQMLKQGNGGSIVNMASILGMIGCAGTAAYTAAKHGIIGLTKVAALENARSGIRINAVCPAFIETAIMQRTLATPAARNLFLGYHPVGRFGKPDEIAKAVLWMCSDEASFMTGESLVLDGGMLAGPNPPR
jgi:NAD(P)-dependent dehydrogenase (short-subunit alcohol dehydrogenase family)